MSAIRGRHLITLLITLPTIVNNHLFNSPVRSRAFVQKITRIIASFSRIERIAFFLFVWLFVISFFVLLWNINKSFLIEIPADGGSLTEGIIGAPRFINPLLAISDADRDLTILTYSGLLRATALGTLVPDLAQEYSISDDGLTYTFVLRDDIFFHDGTPITADDVVFTVTKAQDSVLKSPKRASWDGVVVEKENDKTVVFRLKQAYAPFLENTTLGILPKHIWEKADPEQFSFSQFNITPVGSGPYIVDNIERDSSGVPASYDLSAFKKYAVGKPHITELHVRFYANEEELTNAFKEGDVESINAISPKAAEVLKEQGYRIERSSLPRIFGVFFNQNQAPLFTDIAVRKALSVATDKERIISEVLYGYGTPIDSPIPPGSIGYLPPQILQISADASDESSTSTPSRTDEARAILERNGWTFNEEKGV
ncbi:MAG: ABC transporter substrate-binding protein, partial [Candidatus Yonathbacteria bacterium]|nr:ABC transporter substrate-binding protein [Candidatus Yonathbacteria bacterium]